jgi:hypothetical protein
MTKKAAKPEQEKTLSDYEQAQVEKIAAWKAEFPNPFGELFRRVAQPVAHVVEYIVPDRFGLAAIHAAYKAADRAATTEDLKVSAGVHDLSELRHKSLELCDGLSRTVGTSAQGLAAIEGALTGAGGVWTALLDAPLLVTLCLSTIIKTGRCYGYPLDKHTDQAWALGALGVALSSTKEKRTDRLARLREIEHLLLEETQQSIIIEEIASLLTQIEIFEDIPVFGAATGALLNLSVAHRTDVTARHLFQERWLRDNGKIREIEPAPYQGFASPRGGWSGALARAGAGTVYGLGYGVAFPVCLVIGLFARMTEPLTSRIWQGARTSHDGQVGGSGYRRRGRNTRHQGPDGRRLLTVS